MRLAVQEPAIFVDQGRYGIIGSEAGLELVSKITIELRLSCVNLSDNTLFSCYRDL